MKSKILSVTECLNFLPFAEDTRRIEVTYTSYKRRTYRYAIPGTVQKFMETHEKTTTEYENGRLIFNIYE